MLITPNHRSACLKFVNPLTFKQGQFGGVFNQIGIACINQDVSTAATSSHLYH